MFVKSPVLKLRESSFKACLSAPDLDLEPTRSTTREKADGRTNGWMDGWMEINMLGIFLLFQVDQEAVEEFNLTSEGDFQAVKSLVLGRVHGEQPPARPL